MRLKSVEIQGFKSFPDKTKLTFEKDITAVIGPNGSGKSNISDSIRWVLGEQSSKSLRGQKMEDVIFGGTLARKKMGFAEVSLTIDDPEHKLMREHGEVSITRRYFRSGDSEYRINGTVVRLKDIHELFMDTGLGRDGYSMIGQGRIDEIVSSRSDERRDIFEEAAGISKFRYRKAEAERKLKQTEENLVRLRDILLELEGRVGPLAEQSKKASEFLEYAAEKRELEIGLWLHTLSRSKDLLREQDYKITLCGTNHEQVESQLKLIEEKSEQAADLTRQITVKIDEIRRTTAESEEQAAAVRGEAAVLENTVFHNNETIERLKRDIESAGTDDKAVDSEILLKSEECEKIKQEAAEKEIELSKTADALSKLAGDHSGYTAKIGEKNEQLSALAFALSEERVKLVTAETAFSEISERMGTAGDGETQLKERVGEAAAEAEAIESDLLRIQTTIEECTNVVKGHEFRITSKKQKLETKRGDIDRKKLDVGEKLRRAQILEDLEKNMEGFSFAVKRIMKEGTLRGILGPVSRIIETPKDYSVAVETALGASVQHVVTATEEDAKRAISFLKNANAGRATFLPLTSIKGNMISEKGLEDLLGFIGIASELVSFDSKYSQIVRSLLGRTIVCEDMDSAAAIAKRFSYRYRVVTLDGQIVNAGGSLTGGSHIKNAGLLSRAAEIEQLRNEAEGMKKALDILSAEYKTAYEELSAMEAERLDAQSEVITANEDRIRLLGEQKRVADSKREAEERLRLMETERKAAALRLEGYKTTKADAEARIVEITEQAALVSGELDRLSGGQNALTAQSETLSARLSEIRLEILAKQKDAEALETSVAELRLSKTGRAGRIEELLREIAEIEIKNVEAERAAAALSEKAAMLLAGSAESENKISDLSKQREQAEQDGYKLRALEREKNVEREKISGELARLEERKATMLTEYDEVINKLYDEYELTRREAEETGIVIDDPTKATRRLNEIKSKIRALGSVNLSAIEEYKEVSERYEFLTAQVSDVEKTKDELYALIDKLTDQMKEMFIARFGEINTHFSIVFKELFGGGTAELRLSDQQDVLNSPIEIIAQPPGKNISILEQLSGGEKALIAVAIYFAIMKVSPPPFCLLDEVEAALDDVNVDRFAAYLRKMSGATQFIIITHRRGTMEESDVLYGVTMQEKGVSKLLSIDVSQIERTLQS